MLIDKVLDRLCDRFLRVQTGGIVETNVPDGCHASTVPYRTLHKLLWRLDLQEWDTFVDIGCGTGRVMALAARLGLRGAFGVEANETVANIARSNVGRVRGLRSAFYVHNGYAQHFHYGDCTAGFCFNAFGPATLRAVLAKIRADRGERQFRLCFLNPSIDQLLVFRSEGWRTPYESGFFAGMPVIYTRLNDAS